MLLVQRLRRLVNRLRRRLFGAGADHEPVVTVEGRPAAPPAPPPPRARVSPSLSASRRALVGFVAALALAGLGYAWLAALDAQAPPRVTPASRAAPPPADAAAACLALLEHAAAAPSDPVLIWSPRREREALARWGVAEAVGAAAAALSGPAGAAAASALAPAAALARADGPAPPARLRTAAEGLARADLAAAPRPVRVAALAAAARAQFAAAADGLRAGADGWVLAAPAAERRIARTRASAAAWAVILRAELGAELGGDPAGEEALDAVAAAASFAPLVFRAEHPSAYAVLLERSAAALDRLAVAVTPPLRGRAG